MKTENKRWLGWGLFILVAGLCLLIAFHFDGVLSAWFATNIPKAVRRAMSWVSKIGDWPGHIVLGLLLLGIAWWRGNKSWQRIFLAMLIACAVAGVAARILKIAVGRPRPSVQTEAVSPAARFTAKYQSFPSGHTAASAAFFGTLFLARRRVATAALLLVPAIIALSRMIVGAHYLSDVVFAATLGILCAGLTTHFFPRGDDRLFERDVP